MSIFGPRYDVLMGILRPKDDVLEDVTVDYFIDSKKNEASFDYNFGLELNIKSVTLKSIMFYNSWWTTDIHDGNIDLLYQTDNLKIFSAAFIPNGGHYSLSDMCAILENILEVKTISHVKIYCNENNYIIIELTENNKFNIADLKKKIYH